MRPQALGLAAALFASLSSALPTELKDVVKLRSEAAALEDFLLVTANQIEKMDDPTKVAGVSATSLLDPYPKNTTAFYLRLQPPGYNSLPRFTLLSTHALQTQAPKRFSTVVVDYSTASTITPGVELEFYPPPEESVQPPRLQQGQRIGPGIGEAMGMGNVELQDGYLVTVAGEKEGWMICGEDGKEQYVFWKGAGVGCKKTFLHAVDKAPYV